MGLTVTDADDVFPPALADRLTIVLDATVTVLTVNVAVVRPAATVTEAGKLATAGLALVKVTSVPPAGAAAEIVTVAVEVAPPITAVGASVSDTTPGIGLTVNDAEAVPPP